MNLAHFSRAPRAHSLGLASRVRAGSLSWLLVAAPWARPGLGAGVGGGGLGPLAIVARKQ